MKTFSEVAAECEGAVTAWCGFDYVPLRACFPCSRLSSKARPFLRVGNGSSAYDKKVLGTSHYTLDFAFSKYDMPCREGDLKSNFQNWK